MIAESRLVGLALDALEEAAAATHEGPVKRTWARKAEREDIRCSICGELINHADQEIYAETGRCLDHAQYARSKD